MSAVREKGDYKEIPVFVVTNTGGHEKQETYMKLGVTDYYVKSNNKLSEIIEDIKNRLIEIKNQNG